jgi:membrane peptidoglycan carboxypeptidase
MGLTTLNDPDRIGLTLVLGGGEVRLKDMTHAYGVFANEGVKATPRSILRIEDIKGNVISESEVTEERVLDANIARMVSDVLSDNVARAPLWGGFSLVNFGERDVALKSGSTNDLRDAWIMGYAPNIAVGAWVGNNDNAAMGGGLSGLITTPMWREFMDVALEKLPEESFTQPQIVTTGVKPMIRGQYLNSQLLVDQSNNENGNFNTGVVYQNIHNILHFVDRSNPNGAYPTNPASDPAYTNWEYGVRNWVNATYGSILDASSDSEDEDGSDNTDFNSDDDSQREENTRNEDENINSERRLRRDRD